MNKMTEEEAYFKYCHIGCANKTDAEISSCGKCNEALYHIQCLREAGLIKEPDPTYVELKNNSLNLYHKYIDNDNECHLVDAYHALESAYYDLLFEYKILESRGKE